MHLAQQGVGGPIGVEPPLAETDHLWWERFTHETPPGYKSLVNQCLHSHDHMLGEIQDGVVRAMWEDIVRIAEGEENIVRAA